MQTIQTKSLIEMLQNLHNSYSDFSSPSSSSSSQDEVEVEVEVEVEEEDYINMEVHHHHSSLDMSSIFNQSSNNDFEFQQSFSTSSDAATSPADELFYMGKLLPLHLPPRLHDDDDELEPFATPLFTPTAATPFQSCNVSPSQSRHLTLDDFNHHLLECTSAFDERKPWTRNMKIIKQSTSSSKNKWTSYIKSLFTKSSGCTSQHSAAAAVSKAKMQSCNARSKYDKSLAPFRNIKYAEEQRGRHRRSFSEAFKQLSKPVSSSSLSLSTSSFSSIYANNLNLLALKRNISSRSETDSPIQAAIAHCKRS